MKDNTIEVSIILYHTLMDYQKRFIPLILLGIVLVIVLGWFRGDGIDDNTYQAVFLDNSQLYFGKLSNGSDQYLQLSDIYYMRENAKNAQAELSLIKYGEEIHQPQDLMFINQDHVLSWQNLRPEGKMVQLIYQQKLQSTTSRSEN